MPQSFSYQRFPIPTIVSLSDCFHNQRMRWGSMSMILPRASAHPTANACLNSVVSEGGLVSYRSPSFKAMPRLCLSVGEECVGSISQESAEVPIDTACPDASTLMTALAALRQRTYSRHLNSFPISLNNALNMWMEWYSQFYKYYHELFNLQYYGHCNDNDSITDYRVRCNPSSDLVFSPRT